MSTNLYSITLLCTLLFLTGCHRQPSTQEEESLSAFLTEQQEGIFTHPARTYATLDSVQRTLTDSALWWKVELFKATTLFHEGKKAEAKHKYAAVADWCKLHPEAVRLKESLLNHLGVNEHTQGNMDRALELYEQSLACAEGLPQTSHHVAMAINMGDAYMLKGEVAKSALYYHKALYLCDSLRLTQEKCGIHAGLGQVYMELGNYREAHHYFDLALRDLRGQPLSARLFYEIARGNCYYYEERLEEAKRCFLNGHRIAKETGDPTSLFVTNGNLAEVYLMQDSTELAAARLDRCFAMDSVMRTMPQQMQFYLQSLREDLDIARHGFSAYFRQDGNEADTLLTESPRYLMLHYLRLSRYARRDGYWRDAFNLLQKSQFYADKLNSRQNRAAVTEMSQRYARDTTLLRQRLDLTSYKAREERRENIVLLGIALALIVVLTVVLATIVYRRRTQGRLKQQMEHITQLRMQIIRNRMSPHYLFNVLGTMLPKMQRYPELEKSIDLFIDVIRGCLLTSDKLAVPLSVELQQVRKYVELYHASLGDRPDVTWEIDSTLEAENVQILSYSLQIPVENALKHAFEVPTDRDVIHISVIRRDDCMEISVTDNGRGYHPGSIPATGRDTGTGLRLLSRSIEIMNQYNRRAATLDIQNLPEPRHGTRIEILIPLTYSFRF